MIPGIAALMARAQAMRGIAQIARGFAASAGPRALSAIPPPSVALTFNDRELQRAMHDYAQLKIKSDATVVNKAMRFWVPFAGRKVKDKTPFPSRLRRKLMAKSSRKPPKTKGKSIFMTGVGPALAGHPLAKTIAAQILAGRLANKHGSVAASGLSAADFYSKVQALVNAKVGSVNYLRAGFIPIYKSLRIPPKFAPKNHAKFQGRSVGQLARENPFRQAESWVKNEREGTAVVAPNAFKDSVPEVTKMFRKWILQDLQALARRTGFTVTP